MAQRHRRIDELDALRGIAALYVVLYHYTLRYEELFHHGARLPFVVPEGESAVDFFFVISGFVIFMTLERVAHWKDFVVSRLSRLFPVFWASIAITSLAMAVFGLPGQRVTFAQALANGIMVHNLFGVRHVDGAYWSLEVEVLFYGCMLGLYQARLLSRIPWVLLAWMAIGPLLELAPALAPTGALELLRRVLILDHVPMFAIGITFYRWWKTATLSPPDLLVIAAALVREGLQHGPAWGFLAGSFCFVFSLIATGQVRLLSAPVPVFLGTISYSLYLVHQRVGYVVMHELQVRGVGVSARIACAFVVVLPLATALTFLVERPCQRALRALLQRKGRGLPVGAARADR